MIKFLKYTILILVFLSMIRFLMVAEKNGFSDNISNGKKIISNLPLLKKTPCEKTLRYSIGEFDEEFGISKDEFIMAIREAEYVWESELGANLFQYDSESQFAVGLHFDERQQRTVESETLTKDYETVSQIQNDILGEYKKLNQLYQTKISTYNESIKEYEDELEEYNSDVEEWSNKGGAPKKEYEKLKEKESELQAWYERLEKERNEINVLTEKINKLASKENEVVESYNENVKTYSDKYGETQEFDQGEYNGKEIMIYQFKEKQDLVLVLAHELGHALNLGHVENSKSIMYYLMGDQDMNNIKLTQEDLNALNVQCGER